MQINVFYNLQNFSFFLKSDKTIWNKISYNQDNKSNFIVPKLDALNTNAMQIYNNTKTAYMQLWNLKSLTKYLRPVYVLA